MPQYFDNDPALASDPVSVDVALHDIAFRYDSDHGVFANGRLDTGTRVLLQTAPALPPTGTFADIGCGAGPIALAMALRSPQATVWAVDVNDRARALTTANAAALGLTNITVAAPDDVPVGLIFDRIWSNPPIRIGKAALHELLQCWLDRLAADGSALLVVQKNLGADSLQRWLVGAGYPTARAASKAGFRLLDVTRR